MPRTIDHHATSPHPADRLYAATVDRDLIEKRLQQMGGPGAGLTAYETTPDGVRYTVRHGIAKADLPSVVSSFVPGGDLKIDRTEQWRDNGDGTYTGTGTVAVVGTPATATSSMGIDPAGDGSEIRIQAVITVKVPLFGAKIEESVAGQIKQLLVSETDFTLNNIS